MNVHVQLYDTDCIVSFPDEVQNMYHNDEITTKFSPSFHITSETADRMPSVYKSRQLVHVI